jgi:hypothetical protein
MPSELITPKFRQRMPNCRHKLQKTDFLPEWPIGELYRVKRGKIELLGREIIVPKKRHVRLNWGMPRIKANESQQLVKIGHVSGRLSDWPPGLSTHRCPFEPPAAQRQVAARGLLVRQLLNTLAKREFSVKHFTLLPQDSIGSCPTTKLFPRARDCGFLGSIASKISAFSSRSWK